jgi:hypothetical protein
MRFTLDSEEEKACKETIFLFTIELQITGNLGLNKDVNSQSF